MNDFANKLIELRKQNGLSQEDLAKKLFVSRQAVSKWENQKSLPSIDLIYKISEIFKINIEELIDNKNMREISLENKNALLLQNKKNKIIVVVLIFTVILSIIGASIGFFVFNQNKNAIEEDEFIGILIHIDSLHSNRDGEIVNLNQLASERNPYFIIRTAIEEGSDLPVTRTHSYGFSGGSLHLGNTKEYKGNFYFDENKIDKNSIAQYYYIMENLKSKIYLKHHINFSLNSLPISNFSESNKVIQVVPKKINSIIKLEIISFSSENKILNTSVISNLQKDFSIERETSYIEIKSKYLDKNGVERSVSERKTTFELQQEPFYTRKLTDDKGFLINDNLLCFDLNNL